MKYPSYLLLLFSLIYPSLLSAVTTQDLNTGLTAEQLVNTLLSSDAAVSVSNVSVTGDPRAVGLFSDGIADGFEIDTGIMLSTGDIAGAVGPNLSDGKSIEFNSPGDETLETIARGATLRDAAALEFDFIPSQDGRLQFRYVFASEEYNEFVGAQFNDVFGFFLDDVNIATLGGQAVAINSINRGSGVFNNNSIQDFTPPTPFATEFDGFTDALTAEAIVQQGVTYRIKLVIADSNDASFDSAVFLEQGAFRVNAIPVARFDAVLNRTDPLQIDLDGSASSDSDGSIASYTWTNSDGQTADGQQTSITVAAAGTYTISLTVTDNEGATATTQQSIVVTGEQQQVAIPQPPPEQIPTLSEWAMILLVIALLLVGFNYQNRRQQ